jgi:phenylalanyl-tRNA synthetase beta chain
MLPTGLESVAYNLNRKNNNLLLFEFGKTYSQIKNGYAEKENLAFYFTGNQNELAWNSPVKKMDIFFTKGVCESIFSLAGIDNLQFEVSDDKSLDESLIASVNKAPIAFMGSVKKSQLEIFSVKQPVFFLCIDWETLLSLTKNYDLSYEPIIKFPQVQRDLAIVIDKSISYQHVENLVKSLHLFKLTHIQLFDVFENEKLGEDKKSLAFNFTFSDKEKTLTDTEIEALMDKIITMLQKEVNALIRSNA